MPKNIVLCCDGTANEFAKNRTNVIKLYSTLVHDTDAQLTYYHPGIGTMEPFGALSPITRKLTRVLGMAVGYGLEKDIQDLYAFLMQTYHAGDSIYLFGFSRGAFTVRTLAGFMNAVGLLEKEDEFYTPELYALIELDDTVVRETVTWASCVQHPDTWMVPIRPEPAQRASRKARTSGWRSRQARSLCPVPQ